MDGAGESPAVSAAAQLEGLTKAAQAIEKIAGATKVGGNLAPQLNKFRQFANEKAASGCESGVVVEGKRIPQDMIEACAQKMKDYGGEGIKTMPELDEALRDGPMYTTNTMTGTCVWGAPLWSTGTLTERITLPPKVEIEYEPYAVLKSFLRDVIVGGFWLLAVGGSLAALIVAGQRWGFL